MSKKAKIISITVGLIFVFLSLRFYPPRNINTAPPDNPVNFTELSFVANEKTTVYDFMDKLRSEGKINFVEKNYTGMGKFIETINGMKSGSDRSWIYYVNGKEAEVGVSNYKINPGDIVSWKYEKNI